MSEHDEKDHRTVGQPAPQEENSGPVEEPVCANCGHPIEPDDIVCPNCGISLVAG